MRRPFRSMAGNRIIGAPRSSPGGGGARGSCVLLAPSPRRRPGPLLRARGGESGRARDPGFRRDDGWSCSESRRTHGDHLRKFSISFSPSLWLFSGWNWVPATLCRARRSPSPGRHSRRPRRRPPRARQRGGIRAGSMRASRPHRGRCPSVSGCGCRPFERVPAHVRHLERGSAGPTWRAPRRRCGPSPGVTPCSRPRVARSCMPTQMPKNGRAVAVDAPPRSPPPCRRSRRGCAGSRRRRRRREARCGRRRATTSGSAVTTIRSRAAGLAR